MTKKVIILLVVAILALSLTGCMPAGTAQAELKIDSAKADPVSTDFENNLGGLCEYLAGCQVIAGEGQAMSADFIGAIDGKKFTYRQGEASISCELYEFDLNSPSETANNILSSVKEKGFYHILDKDVQAVLSDSGKYMMIYINSKNDESQKVFSDKIHEKFRTFQGK